MFNNREIATGVWVLLLFAFFLRNKNVRQASMAVLQRFFVKEIAGVLLLCIVYSSVIIYLLSLINLATSSMVKDATFWFAGTASLIVMRINSATREEGFFKHIAIDNLKLIVLFEFIVNVHTFSLPVELVVIPVLIILGALKAYADLKPEYHQVSNLLGWLFFILTSLLLYFSTIEIINEPDKILKLETIKSILFPILLTILFIPMAYLIAVIFEYDSLFVMLQFKILDKQTLKKAKRHTLQACHFSLSRVSTLHKSIYLLRYESDFDQYKKFLHEVTRTTC